MKPLSVTTLMRKSGLLLAAMLAMVLLTWPVLAAGGGSFELSWNTLDGGSSISSGGSYTLEATSGQPDAGLSMSGGSYTLSGGFWQSANVSSAPDPDDVYLPLLLKF